jgi:hypothetical protein
MPSSQAARPSRIADRDIDSGAERGDCFNFMLISKHLSFHSLSLRGAFLETPIGIIHVSKNSVD